MDSSPHPGSLSWVRWLAPAALAARKVPDSHSIEIRLTVPKVNVADEPVTLAGFAALTEH